MASRVDMAFFSSRINCEEFEFDLHNFGVNGISYAYDYELTFNLTRTILMSPDGKMGLPISQVDNPSY